MVGVPYGTNWVGMRRPSFKIRWRKESPKMGAKE